MRLVCPNCGAQYEVDDRVMPENGRDVQCSNCGHAWFQLPPNAEAEEPETSVDEVEAPSPFDDIDELDDDVSDETDMSPDAVEEDAVSDTGNDEADDENGEEVAKSAQSPRQLEDGVRNILQEEAERELKARDIDRESIETQTDLGLDEAPGSDAVASASRAAGFVEQTDETPVASDDPKRRDALPDIEEINSTLDAPENDADVAVAEDIGADEAKSGGFRRGFVLVVVLACVLAILYIFASTIGERIPALQPAMEKYIQVADSVRVALEDMMRTAISKMQGLIDKPDNG